MKTQRYSLPASLAIVACSLAACSDGSSSGEDSNSMGSSPGNGDDGSPDAPSGDAPRLEEEEVLVGADPAEPSASEAEVDECAVQKEEATLRPVYLLFLLDQSGSMGDGEHGQRTEKWDPVTEALKAFFADAGSEGMHAALTLFPPNLNTGDGAANSSYGIECGQEPYQSPQVPLTPLPEANVFATAIDGVAPPNEWGTPTEPALAGIVTQAEQFLMVEPGAEVVIVMVTDGEPAQCDDSENSVAGTVAVAEGAADRVPIYVVGVGDSLDDLDRIAEGGGTDAAFIVPIDDPAQTQQDLIDTFGQIRGQVISCSAPIPNAPAGRIFEKEKVAVEIAATDSGGGVTSVDYDPDCEGGQGWRYDDIDAPSEILLCDATCDELKAMTDGALNVVFACQELIGIAR